MKKIWLSFFTSLMSCSIILMAADFKNDDLINFVKMLNVQSLNKSLPDQTLESWINNIVGNKLKVEWYVTDYDEDQKMVELIVGFKVFRNASEYFDCAILVGTQNGIEPEMISIVATRIQMAGKARPLANILNLKTFVNGP